MASHDAQALLPLLDSPDPAIRDEAALRLRDLGDSAAVEPLWNAIRKSANANHRGTLVYALQTFDCSQYFSSLLDLVLFSNYEVQCGALSILQEQKMQATSAELENAEAKLKSYNPPAHMAKEDVNLLLSALKAVLLKLGSGN